MQTAEDKTVISGLHRYTSDQYRLPIVVGCVGGDFSQTVSFVFVPIFECCVNLVALLVIT